MGAVGGLIGLGGGAAGTDFAGPAGAQVNNVVQSGQANDAYQRAMEQFQNQAGLLQALQGQNGIQNQSNVYNQLQGVANGTGPNPAQAMLNQATGANVANQAALMAGQRGASSNVGLLARQAAQQGAATQQQAAGQGASLQAQQGLNALGQLGGLSTQQVAQQQAATQYGNQAAQNEQQMLLNQITGQNNAAVQMQGNMNQANASMANTQMQGQQALIGGVMNGAGAALGMMAGGGEIPMAYGFDGSAQQPSPNLGVNTSLPSTQSPMGPQSEIGQFLNTKSTAVPDNQGTFSPGLFDIAQTAGQKALQGGASSLASLAPMLLALAKGGNVGGKLKSGGHVPGKPKVPGPVNSYKNDNVKAILSPGEIVLPRSVTQSKNPVEASAKFVAEVIAKRKGRPS